MAVIFANDIFLYNFPVHKLFVSFSLQFVPIGLIYI